MIGVMADAVSSRVHQIAQHAEELDRAAAFYCDVLGFRLLAGFDPPGLRFLDLGNVRLLLEQGAPSVILYLEVDDLVRARQRLEAAGVEFADEPHMIHRDDAGLFGEPGIEEWMTFFRDSEGNLLSLVERRPAT